MNIKLRKLTVNVNLGSDLSNLSLYSVFEDLPAMSRAGWDPGKVTTGTGLHGVTFKLWYSEDVNKSIKELEGILEKLCESKEFAENLKWRINRKRDDLKSMNRDILIEEANLKTLTEVE